MRQSPVYQMMVKTLKPILPGLYRSLKKEREEEKRFHFCFMIRKDFKGEQLKKQKQK